jgi:hypothetical protein
VGGVPAKLIRKVEDSFDETREQPVYQIL